MGEGTSTVQPANAAAPPMPQPADSATKAINTTHGPQNHPSDQAHSQPDTHAHPRRGAPDDQPTTRSPERQSALHRRAKRHSHIVFGLKWALPVCAVVTVGSIGISIAANYIPEIQIALDTSLIEDGRVVMKNPHLKGVDRQKRPFELTATRAITDLSNPSQVELEMIDAKVPVDDKTFADVKANHGQYDNKNEILVLRENVQLNGARGMDIRLEDARINMKTGNMVSSNPVTVKSDRTDISANAISVERNGAKIVFTENVRMTINQPVARGSASQ